MQPVPFALLAELISDPGNGWSIGGFGAVGEFVRDAEENAVVTRTSRTIEVVTARGGIRVEDAKLAGLAWDTLSADGESWGHALAFCVRMQTSGNRVVRALGADASALREEDRRSLLYDLGVGVGGVVMAARTTDPALVATLDAVEGRSIFEVAGIMGAILAAQPHRVLLSPAGRIEVYQPIPPADGKSPEGPHTHLLPKLIAKERPHSSNTPIPKGWQSALTMHPRSAWRTMLGQRHPFQPATDAAFAPLLARFGLAEDAAVARDLTTGLDLEVLPWPSGRRARHKARIVLRRLDAAGDTRARRWRTLHDRAPVEDEEGAPG